MARPTPQEFRRHFPSLDSMTYLASCSLGARSDKLDTAMSTMLAALSGFEDAWQTFESQVEFARDGFAALIGAPAVNVAVLPNATIGAYQVGSTMNWRHRPGIVTARAEFPSIAHVWLAQRPRRARVTFLSDAALAAGNDEGLDAIDAKTGLVSVPLITYETGRRVPVADFADAAHSKGAKIFVDAYQAVGVEPVDVTQLDCDYLVAGTGKYLLGLPGLAFLYARNPLDIDQMPSLTGWLGRKSPFDFDPTDLTYSDSATRFETGTPCIPAIFAANAGFELISALDLISVRDHVSGLSTLAAEWLMEEGERVIGMERPLDRGAHIAMTTEDAADLARFLALRRIKTSPRNGLVRLSFHYYNNVEDVEVVCDGIRQYRRRAKGRSRARADNVGDRPARALAKWIGRPNSAPFPYCDALAGIQMTGKHFAPATNLETLAQAKSLLPGVYDRREKKRIENFLSVLLDKYEGKYDYSSYIALNVLDLPDAASTEEFGADLDRARDLTLISLIGDLVRFELKALCGNSEILPHLRPERVKSEHRIELCIAALAQPLQRLGGAAVSEPGTAAARAAALQRLISDRCSAENKQAVARSLVPVFIVHDEYLFLRMLQAFELHFAWIAVLLSRAIGALQTAPNTAPALMAHANRVFQEAFRLFPLVFNMDAKAFHSFRRFTDGASAVQSVNFKMVEAMCSKPSAARLNSIAYSSVPLVGKHIRDGMPTVATSLQARRAMGGLSGPSYAALLNEMHCFETLMNRWRLCHCNLARHFLGDRSGTGYTEGVPYLEKARRMPVFGGQAPSGLNAWNAVSA